MPVRFKSIGLLSRRMEEATEAAAPPDEEEGDTLRADSTIYTADLDEFTADSNTVTV